jgi:RNA polymerase sigma-70 factor, ECF subfamily
VSSTALTSRRLDGGDRWADDAPVVEALRRGDEQAFMDLVRAHGAAMLRLAQSYVRDRSVAEEVVQDTWLRVLRHIDAFEGRSSLKTWIFRILVNAALARARRERRTVCFSDLAGDDDGFSAVDSDRFLSADHPRWPGHWAAEPLNWDTMPERRLLGRELLERVARAIEKLPPQQAQVITLRDIEGWSSVEVCDALEVSEANQRVLLHRARSKVRREIEAYLEAQSA